MSSKSVFESLRELFPQVDSRILRAISIEHAEDINEAVEFILSEVIPAASAAANISGVHSTCGLEQSLREGVAKASEHIVLDDQPPLPLVMPHQIGEAESNDLYSSVADEQRCDVLFQDQLILEDSNSRSGSICKTSDHDNESGLFINHLPGKEDESLSHDAYNQNDHLELLLDREGVNTFRIEQCANFSDGSQSENRGIPTNAEEVYQIADQSSQVDVETIASIFDEKNKSPMECAFEKDLACRSFNLLDMDILIETPATGTCVDSLPGGGDKDKICQDCTSEEHNDALQCENQNSFDSEENSTKLSSNKIEGYDIFPTSLATRSGHFVSTDLLEESINDARNTKKTLLCSMGSIFSLMQEVELLEEKAKQSDQEVYVAAHDILSKVEDLKKIVKQSKDDNDVFAGEVYGERSILATEARELQSRLLRMSEERTEYLSVAEEISRALGERLASAKDDIVTANLEKVIKEESALKALKEEEVLRDASVAETKKLQEEAEENSKLREFLMDRGRIVDSLQGEIAVICEDILLLKQRVDAGLPLSKSLRSSTWSIASTAASRDHQEPPSSLGSLTNHDTLEGRQEAETASVGDAVVKLSSKLALDDWEFFDG